MKLSKTTNPQGIIVRRGLRAIHRAQQASIAGAVHQDARHVREASTKTTVAPAGATRVLAVIIVPQVPRRITRVLRDNTVAMDLPVVRTAPVASVSLSSCTHDYSGNSSSDHSSVSSCDSMRADSLRSNRSRIGRADRLQRLSRRILLS